MLVVVDCGKHTTKGMTQNKQVSFRTKMEKTSEQPSKESYSIRYNGATYLIGEDAETQSYEVSKALLIHKLSTYVAVALLTETHREIDLIVGCPLSIFINPILRQEYQNYLLGEKDVIFRLNGNTKSFYLKSVTALPESAGVIYQKTDFYRNELVGVIDIGGLNTNAAIYDKLKPVKSSMFTLNEGGEILQNKIKHELNRLTGSNYQDYEIPHVLNKDKNYEIVKDVCASHTRRILEEAQRCNWNIDNLKLIFTGGGSRLLAEYITTLIPNATISKNAIWDNVHGFYAIGGVLHGY